MGAQKEITKQLAKQYALRTPTDIRIFEKHWKLLKKGRDYKSKNEDKLEKAINDSFYYLFEHLLVHGESAYRGTGLLRRAPVGGRYVVFSDHHYLPCNNRHNYFQQHHNYNLYRQLLQQYNREGYTLVENGDVEDLVIFEPTENQVDRRVEMTWAQLREERLQRRQRQLRGIIDDYEELYNQIRDTFHAAGRYIKLAGNHDLDLQEPELRDILRGKYPGIVVYDVLSLETDPTRELRHSHPSFLVAHGHQFDEVSHPLYAQRLGEVFSECLGWAFEGADRLWKWAEDGPKDWVQGEPFQNIMAVGKAQKKGLLYEWLQDGHEIAWEYFKHKNTDLAFTLEVMSGERFFKFRHMSETFVRTKLREYYPNAQQCPTLVLGHTHEPRLNPYDPETKRVNNNIANCGSAGRFANLIWGLEIDRGETRVVSWHYRNQRACRQVYQVGTLQEKYQFTNGGQPWHVPL